MSEKQTETGDSPSSVPIKCSNFFEFYPASHQSGSHYLIWLGGQSSGSGSASLDVTFSDAILQTKEVFSVLRLKLALLAKEC
ncbi:hypothetical protein ACVRZR_06280 [Streptococcus entericus]|uniref:hypothetical protein n=1 Tax=Streptococcus entericus TaxID=155680 RepID=UPI000363D7F6|nr:hypothetical protein [Streptococcus entericus]